MNTLLHTEGLQTGYRSGGRKVLAPGVLPDLQIKAGQLICLLGPNGSGKSTLLRTLAGLQSPLEGSVMIDGRSRLTPAELARQMSLVLSDRVSGSLTVYSLVSLGRYPYSGWLGRLKEEDLKIIETAMITTGVDGFRDRHLSTLSDGENQKAMLARALAQDTPLLLLDEPTAHLDWPSRIQLMRLLHQLAVETNRGILLSTHELELALQIADEIWLLHPGGEFHRGAPEDLVLNGAFESAFARQDVHFDMHTGTFIIPHSKAKPISLEGEGVPAYWTKRALEREGYRVAAGTAHADDAAAASIEPLTTDDHAGSIGPAGAAPSAHVRVLSGTAGPSWCLINGFGEKEYPSITLLLQALQENN